MIKSFKFNNFNSSHGLYVCTIFYIGLYNGLYGGMYICTIFPNGLYGYVRLYHIPQRSAQV